MTTPLARRKSFEDFMSPSLQVARTTKSRLY
jgi:hypothetical protein